LTAQSAMNFLPTVVKGADFIRKVADRLKPIHRETMIPGRLAQLECCVHSTERIYVCSLRSGTAALATRHCIAG